MRRLSFFDHQRTLWPFKTSHSPLTLPTFSSPCNATTRNLDSIRLDDASSIMRRTPMITSTYITIPGSQGRLRAGGTHVAASEMRFLGFVQSGLLAIGLSCTSILLPFFPHMFDIPFPTSGDLHSSPSDPLPHFLLRGFDRNHHAFVSLHIYSPSHHSPLWFNGGQFSAGRRRLYRRECLVL